MKVNIRLRYPLFLLWVFQIVSSAGSIAFGLGTNRYNVSLYTGVPEISKLGESLKQITERSKLPFNLSEIQSDDKLNQLGISAAIKFPNQGVRLYFKHNTCSLILLEPPFYGTILNTKLNLFDSQRPKNTEWWDLIEQYLGKPEYVRNNTSRVIGDVFYYNWGEIQFGASGIRKVLLYRDPNIKKFRINSPRSGDDSLN